MSEPLTPEQRAEKLQSVVVATVEFDTGHKLSTSQSELVTEQATKHIRAAVDAQRERDAKIAEATDRLVLNRPLCASDSEHPISEAVRYTIAAAIRKTGEPT